MIAEHTIQEILDAAHIEEVVGEYMTLKKAGAGLKGLCPFHGEKTPSFSVSPSKGIFKCFGCGKAGNAVNFIMEHEGMSYPEALKSLAQRYNIPIEEDVNKDADALAELAQEKEGIELAVQFAQKNFTKQLYQENTEAKVALAYFEERGLLKKTMDTFGLGFAPKGWEILVNLVKKGAYNLDIFQKAGLIKKRNENAHDQDKESSYFDVFRNRLIFPISNVAGRVVGFGGRIIIPNDKEPKYLNSPDTPIYDKSKLLFGLHLAKQFIKQKDECYLVEGYMDVIMLHQNGFKNVVASAGTSITKQQITQLRRFTKNINLLYDGDNAGTKAAYRAIDIILENDCNPRVVELPIEEDPDSLCKKLGFSGFENYLANNTLTWLAYKKKKYAKDTNDPIHRAKLITDLLQSIAKINDLVTRGVFAHELSNQMNLEEQMIAQQIRKFRSRELKLRENINGVGLDKEDSLVELQQSAIESTKEKRFAQEDYLMSTLIYYGAMPYDMENNISVAQFVKKDLEEEDFQFELPLLKKIYLIILEKIKNKDTWDDQFFVHHPDIEISQYVSDKLANKEFHKISNFWWDFAEKKVRVPEENYLSDVNNSLYYFKWSKLQRIKLENQKNLENASEEDEIEKYLLIDRNLSSLQEKFAKDYGIVVVPDFD
ncbi:MAG: DNA primase [Bacteroidota bacterium]|nr:DNA primase [Bacteroidota bacterium]